MSLIFNCIVLITIATSSANNEWILEADSMWNPDTYPVLANGHIGFTVFDTDLYMNGLFNGKLGKSHRARIENHANYQTKVCATNKQGPKAPCSYRLDLKRGLFEVFYNGSDYALTHQVFPHRYYTRTIVNKFTLERRSQTGNITTNVTVDAGNIAMDMTFPDLEDKTIQGQQFRCEHGWTLEAEVEGARPRNLSMCYSQNLKSLSLPDKRSSMEYYAFLVVDPSREVVENELGKVLGDSQLMHRHTEMWEDFWDSFDIEIDSRMELTSLARSSIYNLACNLPSPFGFEQHNDFFGISASGLGRVDSQTKGRISWDMELFTHLPALLMSPQWSADILDYRYRVRATNFPLENWVYFWEMGVSGQHLNIFSDLARTCHVAGDVALALRQHLSATHDLAWFKRQGCEIAFQTAQYWAARSKFNDSSDLFEITSKDDENNDDPFTSVVAAMNLYLGEFATCLCPQYSSRYNLKSIARSLTLPYGKHKEEPVKTHQDYELYLRTYGADSLFLIYPLGYPMTNETRQELLQRYQGMAFKNSPPTTLAMQLISQLETQDAGAGSALFYTLTTSFVSKPFNTWTDRTEATRATVYNFVPGASAFLQLIMNGYGGIRLFPDRLEIANPKLPPDSVSVRVKKLSYLGAKFTLEVFQSNFSLELVERSASKGVEFVARVDGKEIPFNMTGEKIVVKSTEKLQIVDKAFSLGTCQIPETVLGVPKSQKLDVKEVLRAQARANGPQVVMACFTVAFLAVLIGVLFIVYRRRSSILPNTTMRYIRSTA